MNYPLPPQHNTNNSQQIDTVVKKERDKDRLREFDALRGFSMFIVVMTHVMSGIDLGGESTVIGTILISFRMPLFFFVSGFFTWKIWNRLDGNTIRRVTAQKFKALIICTLVFNTLLAYVKGNSPTDWLETGFVAYWFTIALFEIYIFYLISVIISKVLGKDIRLFIMAVVSIIALCISFSHCLSEYKIFYILNGEYVGLYLQFFTLGLFVRQFQQRFLNII